MCPDQHENQSDPELVIDVEDSEIVRDGFAVRVRGGGTVRYFGDGFKTPEIAWEAGREFVKKFLRAQLQHATGVSVRAERPAVPVEVYQLARSLRPAFVFCAAGAEHPRADGPPTCLLGPMAEQLEGEQLCSCGHTDGVHYLGANHCDVFECPCAEFEPVAQVEAVQ
jgi:hypothetical protein